MKKLLAILLSVVVIFGCVACGGNQNNQGQGGSSNKVDQVLTDRYVLNGGLTDYKIVVNAGELPEYEAFARDELILLFKEATGVTLQVVDDTARTFSENDKFFSIGYNNVFKTSGITVSEEIQNTSEFQIVTKGNSIFFFGDKGLGTGVLFAVYEYLFRTLNFEQFSYDCYSLDKGVTEIPFYEFDVLDGADFYNYTAFSGYMNRRKDILLRMKASLSYGDDQGSPGGSTGHNSLLILPPSKHDVEYDVENYHPKWFADDRKQLCYTAHGDEKELDLMIKQHAKVMIEAIKAESDKFLFFIHSGMDNHLCCGCQACSAHKKKYGVTSAAVIQYVNRVHDIIMEWFKTDEGKAHYRSDYRSGMSFYEAYQEAPAYYDAERGEYVPIDETVVLREGILASSAPAYANWQVPLTDPVNSFYYNNIMCIKACSHETRYWIYATNFVGYYLYPFDNFSSMQQNYQLMHANGARSMLDETQNGNYEGMTGWHMLKSYLQNQLAWDIYADMNALIDRFFKAYFLDAAEDMMAYFNSYLNFSKLQMSGLCPGIGAFTYAIGVAKYWPKPVIDTWQGYVENALKKIEKYKTLDPATYDMLYKHITMERVFLDLVYLRFYETQIGMEFETVRDRFVEGVRLNKIEQTRSGTYIEDYIATLYE